MAKYKSLSINFLKKNPGEEEWRRQNFTDFLLGDMTASLIRDDIGCTTKVRLRLISLERTAVEGKPVHVKMRCEVRHMEGEDKTGYRTGEFTFEFEPLRQEYWLVIPLPPEMVVEE